MQQICANGWCNTPFEVTDEDRQMLATFDIDCLPQNCPTCRHLQRGTFFPALVLYRQESALSGKPIITVFNPAKSYAVYSIEEWWGDAWDAISYGKEYDPSLPFFSQFDALYKAVPKIANFIENCENCDYCSKAGSSKNAYYSHRVFHSEDVYYSETISGNNQDIFDCLRCQRSNRLYECVQCLSCQESVHLQRCNNTRNSAFCIDCTGCHDCLYSWNLRNASYRIFNEQVSPAEFERAWKASLNGSFITWMENVAKWKAAYGRAIWPHLYWVNCEDCRGDLLTNCSECFECYNCANAQKCRYCWELSPSQECVSSMDLTGGGIGELLYNSTGLGGANYFLRMCSQCRLCSSLTYCIDCYSSKDCFGCTGLKNKRFCILNKQYSENDYRLLVDRIVARMREDNQWGAFFPPHISSFAYNESIFMHYHPLTREEALRRGLQWADLPIAETENGTIVNSLPDNVGSTDDEICMSTLTCAISGKRYKIIPQELAFYRSMNVPIPREHPDVRMARRRRMINPYRLFERSCAKCGKAIVTSYAPDRPEKVYCETCYLETVY